MSEILPTVTITPVPEGPSVTITETNTITPPAAPVVNPLAADPGQDWVQQTVGGAVQWVDMIPNPAQAAVGLEDGAGGILLEDGSGYLLQED